MKHDRAVLVAENRVAQARIIGWRLLEQHWQEELTRLQRIEAERRREILAQIPLLKAAA